MLQPSSPLVVGGKRFQLYKYLVLLLSSWALRLTNLRWKKDFFFERKRKKGENVSWRLWQALQIGTALSTAFHGFLESIQRRISFVRDGLSFLLFESLWKLLFSFPDSQSINTDCLRLANVSPCKRDLLWVSAAPFRFPSLCSPSFLFIPAALEIVRCVAQGSYPFPLAIK